MKNGLKQEKERFGNGSKEKKCDKRNVFVTVQGKEIETIAELKKQLI